MTTCLAPELHSVAAVPSVVSRLPASTGGAALTLDYCGGPGGSQTDHTILDLLREHKVPATLFINSRWIASIAHGNQPTAGTGAGLAAALVQEKKWVHL